MRKVQENLYELQQGGLRVPFYVDPRRVRFAHMRHCVTFSLGKLGESWVVPIRELRALMKLIERAAISSGGTAGT